MKKILHIIASPREDKSRTLQVSRTFLDELKAKHPDYKLSELNLGKEELPSLSHKRVDGKYMLMTGKDLFGEAKDAWNEIIQHIERFLSADIYPISTPMWNFTIPYMLKHYIDLIVQPKYLFQYTDQGVEGLAKNKKMIVITSRGGEYKSEEMKKFDFQEPYLRTIFGFVGITDITFINAEPMDRSEKVREEKINVAKEAAKTLAHELSLEIGKLGR